MSLKQLVEQEIAIALEENVSNEDAYNAAKKRVQKSKKGTMMSFETPQGEKKTGKYNGLMNRGGRSYAKIEMGKDGMTLVPVTQIH